MFLLDVESATMRLACCHPPTSRALSIRKPAIERFFWDLTVNSIRSGVFRSVEEVTHAINQHTAAHNDAPKPFILPGIASSGRTRGTTGNDSLWRRLASCDTASPKVWMDAYLAAFAIAGGLRMVTLDHDFKAFVEQGLDLRLLIP
ncbi:MAG TPA: hypothetical protein VIT91_07410 [Chthoniobacterales bacterium]